MKRRAGCIWIAAGVVLALLAGVLAFWAVLQASSQATAPAARTPTVEVVVASRAIGMREIILPEDIEVRAAPVDIVPENAIRKVDEVVGWVTLNSLAPGEMILSSDIVSPTVQGGYFAFTMDKTKVAMAFPADDLMSSNNLLKPGDHVDLLFSIEVQETDATSGELVTFNALQNLEIAAIVQPQDLETQAKAEVGGKARPLAIVFALDPQDALVLKHLHDMGGVVDIVLRAPEAKERFSTQPVNQKYLIDRYQLRIPVLP
ncbi:MAG: Flp pilus assembly protein CpaB [Anaerolineae bacterium]